METPALPFQRAPHDALRLGLASLKEDVGVKHPIEAIQQDLRQSRGASSHQMLRDLYGVGPLAKKTIDEQILSKFGRLPGLPSSRLGLEALTGDLDEFRYESYLGLPEWSEDQPIDIHSALEQQLHIGTQPMARGIV